MSGIRKGESCPGRASQDDGYFCRVAWFEYLEPANGPSADKSDIAPDGIRVTTYDEYGAPMWQDYQFGLSTSAVEAIRTKRDNHVPENRMISLSEEEVADLGSACNQCDGKKSCPVLAEAIELTLLSESTAM